MTMSNLIRMLQITNKGYLQLRHIIKTCSDDQITSVGFTAGVTGWQEMLTPRYMIPLMVYPWACVCPILRFLFPTGSMTVRHIGHFKHSYDLFRKIVQLTFNSYLKIDLFQIKLLAWGIWLRKCFTVRNMPPLHQYW
jgi:hypothetical protein